MKNNVAFFARIIVSLDHRGFSPPLLDSEILITGNNEETVVEKTAEKFREIILDIEPEIPQDELECIVENGSYFQNKDNELDGDLVYELHIQEPKTIILADGDVRIGDAEERIIE